MRLLVLTGVLALNACRAEVRVSTRNGEKEAGTVAGVATPAPTDVPDAMNLARSYFQTRSVVVIDVNADGAAPGDDLSLLNDTTGASLVSHQSLSLDGDDSAGEVPRLLTGPTEEIEIKLYPALPGNAGQFAYGANALRLLVNEEAPEYAQNTIYLHDFPYFALATASFAGNVQESGGLQGNTDALVGQIVTNGVGTLTTGIIATLNR